MHIILRKEESADVEPIARLTRLAFADMEYSRHTEQFIVDALRRTGQLSLSLVAVDADTVVGHVAFSPVKTSSEAGDWYGLGPVSVLPDWQGQGIGSRLILDGLSRLRAMGGAGCVLVGDPAYYKRFGFSACPGLVTPGVPPIYFLALPFGEACPLGEVVFDSAFEAVS